MFVDRLLEEIRMRGDPYPESSVETLYLGGGTPSLLSEKELDRILNEIHGHFSFHAHAEWTIECNPDDLDRSYLEGLRKKGFNRISIGIQSFQEKDLQLMRRSHSPDQGEKAVQAAALAGFDNITIDLIYGIPGQTVREWEQNLSRALSLPVSHLSAYHLTFEPGTVFDHWRRKKRLIPVQEEESEQLYHLLREKMTREGFDHYEISNFAREEKMSAHNLLYWSGKPYLGFGPSAHSYDGSVRGWNVASLKGYLEGISRGTQIMETEKPGVTEKYHDYLITTLRTRWGADPVYIGDQFGTQMRTCFEEGSEKFLEEGSMRIREGRVVIDPRKWIIADHIMRELFTG